MKTETIYINTEMITLDRLLKFSGIVQTGGMAKMLITSRQVLVNGEVCTARGKKIYEGNIITVLDKELIIAVGG